MPMSAENGAAPDRFVFDDSRFLFAFTHDMRSHLRTVLTRIQLVQAGAGAPLPAAEKAFLTEAAAAAGDMNGLLTALVSYGDVTAKSDSLPLSILLRGVLIANEGTLQAAEAEVVVANDIAEAGIHVPVALQGVFKELLSNAVRFRRADTRLRIAITARRGDNDHVEMAVADNGPGVPAADTERIFAPFQRLLSRAEYPGHGMGLAIARRILTAYQGSIAAEPTPGGGLTVRMLVPASTRA